MKLKDVKVEIKEGIKILEARKKTEPKMDTQELINIIERFYLLVNKIE